MQFGDEQHEIPHTACKYGAELPKCDLTGRVGLLGRAVRFQDKMTVGIQQIKRNQSVACECLKIFLCSFLVSEPNPDSQSKLISFVPIFLIQSLV